MTKRTFQDVQEEAYWLGFDHGEFGARRSLREEIRAELQGEIETFDPSCALCVANRDLDELHRKFVAADIDRRAAKAQIRSWAIRRGAREYRETKT